MAGNIGSPRQSRRMQLSGGSTYTISLPKEWVEELGAKAGQNITIVKNSNRSLTLVPDGGGGAAKGTAVIQSGQKDRGESVKRKIISAYLSGYNTIRIRTRGSRIPAGHIRSVRELVRSTMVGTEIVESSSESVVIQVLTRLPELSFETALRRMYLMASTMVSEAVDAVAACDIAHADEVVNMDDEVDRFGLYMRRNLVLAVGNEGALRDMGLRKASDCLGYRAVISRIERIADHAALVAKRAKFVEGAIDAGAISKIRRLAKESLGVFEESIQAVMGHDYDMGERAAQSAGQVIAEEKQVMARVSEGDRNATIIRFILEDLRRIAEYSSDIAEVAIDENIEAVITRE